MICWNKMCKKFFFQSNNFSVSKTFTKCFSWFYLFITIHKRDGAKELKKKKKKLNKNYLLLLSIRGGRRKMRRQRRWRKTHRKKKKKREENKSMCSPRKQCDRKQINVFTKKAVWLSAKGQLVSFDLWTNLMHSSSNNSNGYYLISELTLNSALK